MKWIAISGGWRITNTEVEADVRRVVREIFLDGNGIVSGGALGVDFIATNEALRIDPSAKRIKLFLPATLQDFAAHYRKRADEGVIKKAQAERIVSQLEKVKKANKEAIIEDKSASAINQEKYYERNAEIIAIADELMAFHINQSSGTANAISKAKVKGIPVKLFNYAIK